MRRVISSILALLLSGICAAQPAQEQVHGATWTLEACIAHAMEHNITIKQSELNTESRKISISASKWAYAPEISATNSYTLSTGRVLDPTTYDFVENQTVSGNNTSVGASVILFGGMQNLLNLHRARLDLRATLLDAEKTRNDVRLNVTAYYLEILCAEESIRNAEQIVKTLRLQEEKTSKLIDARKVTAADLLQIQAELSSAENTLSTTRNTFDIARLNICQLLEIEDWASFRTAKPESEIEYLYNEAEAVFESAQLLPEIASARLGIDIARRDLQIARAAYYPSLSLSAGYGSSYSDVRQKMFQNSDGILHYYAYPFFAQYRDNTSSYISVSLNIPIFGRLSVRKNVQMQKITLRQAEYTLQVVEKQVRREVSQAQIDARTAWEKYLSSQKFVASAEEATRQMERKYNLGVATVLDYNMTLNTLVEAQSQLLQSKYEYLFKTEIIRFYLEWGNMADKV